MDVTIRIEAGDVEELIAKEMRRRGYDVDISQVHLELEEVNGSTGVFATVSVVLPERGES